MCEKLTEKFTHACACARAHTLRGQPGLPAPQRFGEISPKVPTYYGLCFQRVPPLHTSPNPGTIVMTSQLLPSALCSVRGQRTWHRPQHPGQQAPDRSGRHILGAPRFKAWRKRPPSAQVPALPCSHLTPSSQPSRLTSLGPLDASASHCCPRLARPPSFLSRCTTLRRKGFEGRVFSLCTNSVVRWSGTQVWSHTQ